MPPTHYQDCRCPSCRTRLDEVQTGTAICPRCGKALEADAVWATRRYRDSIVLPLWMSAFGWPLLVMAAGVAILALSLFLSDGVAVYIPGYMIATGFVWFVYKCFDNDRR